MASLDYKTVQMVVSPQIPRTQLFADIRYYDCGNMLAGYRFCADELRTAQIG
jgi:hypothetical protein